MAFLGGCFTVIHRSSTSRPTGPARHLRRGAAVLLALLAVTAAVAAPAQAKYASIVIDAQTGAVLHESHADDRNHPASLTKMMTLFLAFDALDHGRLDLNQRLAVSQHAENQSPSKLGLRAGDSIRVEDAILGLVTKSANDAAVVLAEALGGSEARFGALMTQRSREIGMTKSVFHNASGLPNPDQWTSARDMAILARALIYNHGKHYHYFSRRSFTYNGHVHQNHNHLMKRYEGMDGIKTGFIQASGFNLTASAVRNNRRLVGVVLGGPSRFWRDDHMADLLDDAFESAGRRRVAKPAEEAAAKETGTKETGTKETVTVKTQASGARALASTKAAPERKPGKGAGETDAVVTANGPRNIGDIVAATTEPGEASRGDLGKSPSGWSIQIGAFSDRAAGQRALTQATKLAPTYTKGAARQVVAASADQGTVYRARMSGMTEKDAKTACSHLQRNGLKCQTLSPQAGL